MGSVGGGGNIAISTAFVLYCLTFTWFMGLIYVMFYAWLRLRLPAVEESQNQSILLTDLLLH